MMWNDYACHIFLIGQVAVGSLFFQQAEVVLGTQIHEEVSDGLGLHVEGQVDAEIWQEGGGVAGTVQRLERLCLGVGQF